MAIKQPLVLVVCLRLNLQCLLRLLVWLSNRTPINPTIAHIAGAIRFFKFYIKELVRLEVSSGEGRGIAPTYQLHTS